MEGHIAVTEYFPLQHHIKILPKHELHTRPKSGPLKDGAELTYTIGWLVSHVDLWRPGVYSIQINIVLVKDSN